MQIKVFSLRVIGVVKSRVEQLANTPLSGAVKVVDQYEAFVHVAFSGD